MSVRICGPVTIPGVPAGAVGIAESQPDLFGPVATTPIDVATAVRDAGTAARCYTLRDAGRWNGSHVRPSRRRRVRQGTGDQPHDFDAALVT